MLKAVQYGFFLKWGFPQCVGAIDGTHIPILAPSENPIDILITKDIIPLSCRHWWSIIIGLWTYMLDGLVAFTMQEYFLTPYFIRGVAETNYYQIGLVYRIGNTEIPLVILGDPAYPLLPWLMKPYSDTGRLSPRQHNFNHRLSRTRMVVENAFGRLKGRWRSLMKRCDIDVTFLPTYVSTCCSLHNICEIHQGSFNDEWTVMQDQSMAQSQPNSDHNIVTRVNNSARTTIRNALCDYFAPLDA